MPKITHMKATTEVIGGSVTDETVEIEEYNRFVKSLEKDIAYGGGYPVSSCKDVLVWYPNFPFQDGGYFDGTIRDEALYRSNYRVVWEDIAEISESAESMNAGIAFNESDTIGIARAAMWEAYLDDYCVADEEDTSQLEMELIEEAYESYGKQDFLKELSEYDSLSELFDEDGDPIEEYAEFLEEYVYRLADYSAQYSGEMYPSEGAIADALRGDLYEDVPVDSQGFKLRLSLKQYLELLVKRVKAEKALKDRAIEEEVETTLEGTEDV